MALVVLARPDPEGSGRWRGTKAESDVVRQGVNREPVVTSCNGGLTSPRMPFRVRVNHELTLDAGSWSEETGPRGTELVVLPPETTLFHQVLAYLKAKPDPAKRPSGSMVGREGVAAAAVTLRWGSYLAVLLDRDKPLLPGVDRPSASRISDGEMARINIEASAALSEWIDLYRADPAGPHYERLVNRAVAYLPMPKKTAKLVVTEFGALSRPEMAARVVELANQERIEQVSGRVEDHASRVFANALLNTSWRNGPVENIHAGTVAAYPLDRRRVTPTEERELMAFASTRLAQGMTVCLHLSMERSGRSWSEQVLPYGLAEMLLITPSRWTLTETSREVRLPPAAAPAATATATAPSTT